MQLICWKMMRSKKLIWAVNSIRKQGGISKRGSVFCETAYAMIQFFVVKKQRAACGNTDVQDDCADSAIRQKTANVVQ